MKLSIAFVSLLCAIYIEATEERDLYKLLGIQRDAHVKEIRRAFKTLAVKFHPDKNKDDKNADEKFVKLVQAYEVLKDPETRKHYDMYGDAGMLETDKKSYHSYTYYRDVFGIYDDDPLIVTLSTADYEVNVLDDNQAWFVNFYSPQCHHCHELAPTWRTLARDLEGVVRIAAVNCEEDWILCRQLKIQLYPSLLYYEKKAHLHEGELYKGLKTLKELQDFVLNRIPVTINDVTPKSWDDGGFNNQKSLLFLCPEHSAACPQHKMQVKLAAIMEGLMPVGKVTDPDLCEQISSTYEQSPIVFWHVNEVTPAENESLAANVHNIVGSDTKEIVDKILDFLPNPEELDEEKFRNNRIKLRSGEGKAWLICFYLGSVTELQLQLKRLVMMISNINIGLMNCARSSGLCGSLHVSRYPTWGALKHGGAFELHHGRDILHEVASFAKDSIKSTNFHALSPADFINIMKYGSTWFIDWFAPWCPPCRRLMPEVRRASQHFDPDVIKFGSIDCTLHSQLCSQEGIRSYPTTVMYNASKILHFHGVPKERTIVQFVEDMLNPIVITLDADSFPKLVQKPKTELWIVDYFVPWCGPCQRLAPDWRALAKQLARFKEIKVAQVDCVASAVVCSSQGIRRYPTIRMYPFESKGLRTMTLYDGQRDLVSMKRWIFGFVPSPVEPLTVEEFTKQILTKKYVLPWLVDLYAPWCAHCVNFEPEYITVAQRLQGKVRVAKFNCDQDREFCAKQRVTSFPTVMLYLSPEESYEIKSQSPNEIIKQVKEHMKRKGSPGHDEL